MYNMDEAPPQVDAQVIDLSSHNGAVDFGKMASRGITDVILRATFRLTGKDLLFDHNASHAGAAGLRVGAYHLWDSRYSYVKQAAWFLAVVAGTGVEFAALDVEESFLRDSDNMDSMHFWLWFVSMALGTNTMIYTVAGLWNDWHNSGPVPWAWNFPLWIADYESLSEPDLPTDWGTWVLWQYSADGNRAGEYYGTESTSVDLNVRKRWERK